MRRTGTQGYRLLRSGAFLVVPFEWGGDRAMRRGRHDRSDHGFGLAQYAALVVVAGSLLGALYASGLTTHVTGAVKGALCSTMGCGGTGGSGGPGIECVRAPCGTVAPRPSMRKPVECFRAPCGTQGAPRPRFTPPIECFRAPCGTGRPAPTISGHPKRCHYMGKYRPCLMPSTGPSATPRMHCDHIGYYRDSHGRLHERSCT